VVFVDGFEPGDCTTWSMPAVSPARLPPDERLRHSRAGFSAAPPSRREAPPSASGCSSRDMDEHDGITRAIRRAADGDAAALDDVVAWAYVHLERLAAAQMRQAFGRDLAGVTLEPAALVNETFLKLLEEPLNFENRRHFFAFASTVLKRVLLDYHRRRSAAKRGGGALHVTLSGLQEGQPSSTGVVGLVRALEELEAFDARKAEVVSLRLLWGLEMSEIADAMEVSLSTVERDWRFARSWLAERLEAR
jgi:RNA polymerase sigma factor (TIGR02999 family)